MKDTFWTNEDVDYVNSLQQNMTPLSNSEKMKLGLKKESQMMVETLEDLKNSPPNIIIGKCTDDTSFVQNNFKQQWLKKKRSYVMSLGIYQQLFRDKRAVRRGHKSPRILKPSNLKFMNLYKPYRGEEIEGKRLLVWRTGGIGDLCFIQPNLRFLKEKYPTCEIRFACGPQYQSMVDNWDCVDRVLDLPFELKELMEADYHVLFEGVIERCTEAHRENAYNLFTRWMGLNLPPERLIPLNVSKPPRLDACIEALSSWGVQPNKFALIQLRASSPIRSPRPELWKKVTDALTSKGIKVVITDSPGKAKMIDSFIENVNDKDMVFNFSPHSITLDYTIALTSLAQIVIGTDSALMHLAESVGTKALGIFGPFPGEIRLTTYRKADWINCEAPCAPCFLHGSQPCPKHQNNHGICYDNLDMNIFNEKLERMLNDM